MTVADIQTLLAYRLGENTAPSDATVKAQRLQWINEAYFDIARRKNWWWLEASHATNVNTGSTTGYSEPTDCKEFIEFKVGTIYYDQIPYKKNRVYQNSIGVVTLPSLRNSYFFYRFGGKYYFVTVDGNDGATHNIKYYKRVTQRTSDADTFLMPDEFLPALAAFAESRYWMSITQQAKGVAPAQEFEQIVAQMINEQGMKGSGWKDFGIDEPEDVY